MRDQARLVSIENDRKVTRETDSRFWFEYQKAILLSLKENGIMTEMQYRYAEEKLTAQFRCVKRTICDIKGEGRDMS